VQYTREFLSNSLILFLLLISLLSGMAMLMTFGSSITWLAFAAGIVLFGIIEYITHRFILHEFPKLLPVAFQGHVAHHEHPNDDQHLYGPIRYDLAGYIFLFLVSLLLTGSVNYASAILFGSITCQLYYQWKHFVSHRPIVPLTPWGKWMKKKHLLHHYLDEHAWYGVSNPIMDVMLGTDKPQSSKKSPPISVEQPPSNIHRDL
jgi:4-hydroxysphinganine ceramide fatty acyl 2-hydroxylase